MENTKICSKCGRELPLSEFNKSKTRKDGLQVHCKECQKQYKKQYNAEHADAIKQYFKQYNAEHVEARKQYNKQYRADNAEAIKQHKKQYYADNVDAIKQYKKQYRADNAEYLKQYNKQYNAEHVEARKQYNKQYRATIEGYARQIRKNNLKEDRKYGRIGADEDPLPSLEYYIWALQQPDFYDGEQYHWSEMGLDRIDNSKPHTLDNVVPCSTAHNRQRGRRSIEEFCEIIQKR